MVVFFNDTATTGIYTLSLHDALPIFGRVRRDRSPWWGRATPNGRGSRCAGCCPTRSAAADPAIGSSAARPEQSRSEEHTSELQSRQYLVCRLLLEKNKILF